MSLIRLSSLPNSIQDPTKPRKGLMSFKMIGAQFTAAGTNPGILLDGYRLCISCLWSKWLLNNLSSVCDGERNNKIRVKASRFRDGEKELWKVKRKMTSDNFTNPTLCLVLGLNGLQRVELKQIWEAIHRTKCTNHPIEGHLPGTALGNSLL